jgi:hypothetical protein
LELSPNENKAPSGDYWAALKNLQIAKQRQSMFIENTADKPPPQAQSLKSMKGHSASKLAPLSQLFHHLKGGSKKDKSRRHTIYVASHNNNNDDVIIEPVKKPAEISEGDEDGKKNYLKKQLVIGLLASPFVFAIILL